MPKLSFHYSRLEGMTTTTSTTIYIWVNFLNRYNFGDQMYDFGGRKTSVARTFIRKELSNQRPLNRALTGEFKIPKKRGENMF